MSSSLIAEIAEFWLEQSLSSPDAAAGRRDFWYRGGDAVDKEIRERFLGLVTKACDGELTKWGQTPEGAFALILLLDQFTRNLFRNSSGAYAGDALAFSVVSDAIDNALDLELHPVQRIWLYHPFHHSKSPLSRIEVSGCCTISAIRRPRSGTLTSSAALQVGRGTGTLWRDLVVFHIATMCSAETARRMKRHSWRPRVSPLVRGPYE